MQHLSYATEIQSLLTSLQYLLLLLLSLDDFAGTQLAPEQLESPSPPLPSASAAQIH